MGDLSVRILMNDTQFNDKIESAKRSVKGFSDDSGKAGQSVDGMGGKMASVAAGALAKLVGGLGAAAAPGAAFKRIIESTNSSASSFKSTVEAAKGSVDFFFDSIAIGKFSDFFSGLDGAISRARVLQQELTTLSGMQAGWNDIESDKKSKINENIAEIYDSTTSLERRKELIKENEGLINELSKKGRKVADQLAKVAVQTARREAHISDITEADVTRYLQDISLQEDKAFDAYIKKRKELEAKTGERQETTFRLTKEAKAADAELTQLKANNSELEKFYQINELIANTSREEIVNLRSQSRAIESNISSLKRQNSIIEKDLKGEDGGKSGVKIKAEIIPSGSLTELEKQIQEARKSFLNATTDEARAAADVLITELEAKKVRLSVEFKLDNPGNIKPDTIAPIKTGGKLDAIQEIGKLENEIAKAENSLIGLSDPTRIKKLNSEIKTLKENVSLIKDANNLNIGIPDMSGVFQNNNKGAKNWIDIMGEMGEINHDIAGSISEMGRALDNEAGAWLNWGANVLSSIGQAIPAIAALTTAKSAEATANTASAASGAASSVASIPYVGPILAVAAVASIVAALASVPKFASSGIVPGISFAGDNMLARVNSGEMILNQQHQANLLDMIRIGGSARGDNPGTGGNVTFELAGTKLIGAINNTIAKQNRTGARRPLL